MNPLVSVIVPNYNHGLYLKERIDSILNQTFQDFEIIILDDFSSDNSRSIIETFRHHPKVSHIVFNHCNSGSPFKQWYKGVELAQAELIWIAESDDTADSDFLQYLVKVAIDNPHCSLIYCDSMIINSDGEVIGKFSDLKNTRFKTKKWSSNYISSGSEEIKKYLSIDCTINNASAVVFRKKYLIDAVQKALPLRHMGDWLTYLIVIHTRMIAYVSKPLNNYREHKKNISKELKTGMQSFVERTEVRNLAIKNLFGFEYQKLQTCLAIFKHNLKDISGILSATFRGEMKKSMATKIVLKSMFPIL